MKKKTLLFTAIIFFLFCLMSQFVYAQTCSGDDVLMSKGCACGYKKSACQSKCVKPSQVQNLLKQGWYFGQCDPSCCGVIKRKKSIDSTIVAKAIQISTPSPNCNCNCSLPNYGLNKSQLKNCLSYCYRFCELGW